MASPEWVSFVRRACYVHRVRVLLVVVSALTLVLPATSVANVPPEAGRAAIAEVAAWGVHGTVNLAAMTVSGLAQDSEGRVIALGYGERDGSSHGIVVALGRDGSPDPSYGRGGYFLSSHLSTIGWNQALALPDGGLVIAGSSRWGDIDSESKFALGELDAHGRLVRSFAADGLYQAADASCLRGERGMALEGHKIVVAVAQECKEGDPLSIELVRFNANGSLDKAFGTDGVASVLQLPWYAGADTPLLVVGDHILAASQSASRGAAELIRFTANGALDPSFGNGGTASAQVAPDSSGPPGSQASVFSLFLAKLGRYTIGGCTSAGPFIARFNEGGSPYLFWPGGANNQRTNVEEFGGAFGDTANCAYIAQLPDYQLAVAGAALFRLETGGKLNPFQPMLILPDPHGHAGTRKLLVTRAGALIVATNPLSGGGPSILTAYHF